MTNILLRRKNELVLINHGTPIEQAYLALCTMLVNIGNLGYAFSNECIAVLATYNVEQLTALYKELIPVLQKLRGADVKYRPMYPNFPKQVAEMSEMELFVNAIFHYLTLGTWSPEYTAEARFPLYEEGNMVEIGLGKLDDAIDIARNLLGGNTSLSQQDKDDICSIVGEFGLQKCMPENVSMKETLAFVASLAMEKGEIQAILPLFKTATDVLRLAVSMSGGDVSLSARTYFKRFSRRERRMLLQLLDNMKNPLEDMFRYREQWLRMGEIIHPEEFSSRFKNAADAFRTLRNEAKPEFYGRKLETALREKDVFSAVKALRTRPGEFARKLDWIARNAEQKTFFWAMQEFRSVSSQINLPVLAQAMKHFEGRDEGASRICFPKGQTAKALVLPELLPISGERKDVIIEAIRYGILRQLAQRASMGGVYISPEMKNYIMPFSQRSASSGNMLLRGSKLPVRENARTIRGFVHWTNQEYDRVDIDLSAIAYSEDWKYGSHISYTNLRDGSIRSYHSGDITNGGPVNGDGVAEFIDIDINSVVRNNLRYVVFQVNSYTGQKFNTLTHARFGWMTRKNPNSGEIFEPKTVEACFPIQSESVQVIPVIFDCVERKFIWCDLAGMLDGGCVNVESTLQGTTAVCKGIVSMSKATVWDIAMLHAQARGVLVPRDKADVIFDTDRTLPTEVAVRTNDKGNVELYEKERRCTIITPFDIDVLMGLW